MTRLVYIGGYGRSGSTVLEALLAMSPDVIACGETVGAIRAERWDKECSCGRPALECPVWGPILAEPEKLKHVSHVDLDLALLERLTASRTVMVDSSKTARGAALAPFELRRKLLRDFRLLHLVRDPRAVCWSVVRWEVARAKRKDSSVNVARLYARAALGWVAANSACELFGRRYPDQYMRLRYETLTQSPENVMRDLFREILPGRVQQFDESNSSDNRHQLFGNRLRRKPVAIAGIQPDDEWKRAMPRGYRRLVEALTVFLRSHYGY